MLCDCAGEALVLAFLVQLFGGIALGIVGGLWHEMMPSLPPGLAGKPLPEAEASSGWDFSFFRQHCFAVLFGVIFAGQVLGRLISHSPVEKHRNAGIWVRGILRRLSDQWFDLIVVNGFVALGLTIALGFAQRFSLTHLVWEFVSDLGRPLAQVLAKLWPGLYGRLEELFNWYSANQFKFTFWLLYSAAICDDLGLPNYKTLIRFVRRRWFRRSRPIPAATNPAKPQRCPPADSKPATDRSTAEAKAEGEGQPDCPETARLIRREETRGPEKA